MPEFAEMDERVTFAKLLEEDTALVIVFTCSMLSLSKSISKVKSENSSKIGYVDYPYYYIRILNLIVTNMRTIRIIIYEF
jgi:hypothetical protein